MFIEKRKKIFMKLCNKVKKLHIREFEGVDLSTMCASASVNQEILYSKN